MGNLEHQSIRATVRARDGTAEKVRDCDSVEEGRGRLPNVSTYLI